MKARVALLAAAAVTAAVLVPGVAGAGGSAATTVTIRGPQGDFQGRILSESETCLGERRVTVFRQVGDTQAPSVDERIASDTSEQQGNRGVWSVGNTGQHEGLFYAKVARAPGCRGDRSPTIELVHGVPR
jgi:hypothetical protein